MPLKPGRALQVHPQVDKSRQAPLEEAEMVADPPLRPADPRIVQQEVAQGREADRRQAADLLGHLPAGAVPGAAVRARKPALHDPYRRCDFRDFRRDQRLLDLGHRHREHLLSCNLRCGRHGGLPDSVAVHQLRPAVVGTAADRNAGRNAVRRNPGASGVAPRRLLLCAFDSGSQ